MTTTMRTCPTWSTTSRRLPSRHFVWCARPDAACVRVLMYRLRKPRARLFRARAPRGRGAHLSVKNKMRPLRAHPSRAPRRAPRAPRRMHADAPHATRDGPRPRAQSKISHTQSLTDRYPYRKIPPPPREEPSECGFYGHLSLHRMHGILQRLYTNRASDPALAAAAGFS